jgi:hypothetical protein
MFPLPGSLPSKDWIRISPLQFSSLRAKTQKQTEILCRLDRAAPQVGPQNVQGNAVPPSLGTTALFEV